MSLGKLTSFCAFIYFSLALIVQRDDFDASILDPGKLLIQGLFCP